MSQETINFCIQNGILLDKQILQLVKDIDEDQILMNILERMVYHYKQKIITKSLFSKDLLLIKKLLKEYQGPNKKIAEKFFEALGLETSNIEDELDINN